MVRFFKRKSKKIDGMERKVATDDAVLMVLIDKYIPNFQKYLCDRGINVSHVYRTVEEAKVGMFMNSSCCRLIVIETGIGVFTTTKVRAELTDLLGIADGVNWFISVFYTDNIIKSENSRKIKNVDWYGYSTVSEMIEQLNTYGENYVLDGDVEEEKLDSYEDVLKLRFNTVEEKADAILSEDIELIENDMIDIIHNREEYYMKEQAELEQKKKIELQESSKKKTKKTLFKKNKEEKTNKKTRENTKTLTDDSNKSKIADMKQSDDNSSYDTDSIEQDLWDTDEDLEDILGTDV